MTLEELRSLLDERDIVYLTGVRKYTTDKTPIKFAMSGSLSIVRRSGYLFYTDVHSFFHESRFDNRRLPGYSKVQHTSKLEHVFGHFDDIKLDNITLYDMV